MTLGHDAAWGENETGWCANWLRSYCRRNSQGGLLWGGGPELRPQGVSHVLVVVWEDGGMARVVQSHWKYTGAHLWNMRKSERPNTCFGCLWLHNKSTHKIRALKPNTVLAHISALDRVLQGWFSLCSTWCGQGHSAGSSAGAGMSTTAVDPPGSSGLSRV